MCLFSLGSETTFPKNKLSREGRKGDGEERTIFKTLLEAVRCDRKAVPCLHCSYPKQITYERLIAAISQTADKQLALIWG